MQNKDFILLRFLKRENTVVKTSLFARISKWTGGKKSTFKISSQFTKK